MLGTTLEGRFAVERELGAGGMAKVYLARDLADRGLVAIKVLHPSLTGRPELTARLRREATAAARVQHRNVVGIRRVGSLPDDGLYLAMEYLDGTPLDRLIERQGPLPPARAARLLGQLAAGLAALHAAGIVHRDLKPANVMVVGGEGSQQRVVLMDLGLARLEDSTRITATGTFLGTPCAMAPEQLDGLPAGPPADVYAFGLAAFAVLTGVAAYPSADLAGLVRARSAPTTPLPSRSRPDLDPRWDALVTACLQLRPEDRTVSAPWLVAALREMESPEGRRAPPPPARAERPARERSRAREALLPVAAVVVALVAVLETAFGPWHVPPVAPLAAAAPTPLPREPSLADEASSLTGRLRGWRADRATMAAVVDALRPSPGDVLRRFEGKRDPATERELERARRELARSLLERRLLDEGLLQDYRRAAAAAPRVLGARELPAEVRLEFLACLRPFVELRLYADATELALDEALLPRPLLGPFAVRATPLPGRAVEVPLAWSAGAPPSLAHPPLLMAGRATAHAVATVTLPPLDGFERAELRLEVESFETWPLLVRVGRGPETRVFPPGVPIAAQRAATLYVGLDVGLLDRGSQQVDVTCPPLYGCLRNAVTRLGPSAVRLVAGN